MLVDIMEKLDSHIFNAIIQLRNSKIQPNESAIVTILSENLDLFIYMYLTNNLTKLQFVKKRETSYPQYKNCEAN